MFPPIDKNQIIYSSFNNKYISFSIFIQFLWQLPPQVLQGGLYVRYVHQADSPLNEGDQSLDSLSEPALSQLR